ncbi:hypothetical protein SFC66_03925 [Terribacillus saccharophilus]|uniref:hypothetical protein n=1 Tax=Terribacillus saccharophilus TaxID=361277 RepID=UPI0039827462
MKRAGVVILHIVLLIISLFCVILLVSESSKLYNLIVTEDIKTAIVEEKLVYNDLFGNFEFYIYTEDDDEVDVSQATFEKLQIGDTITFDNKDLFGNADFYGSIFLLFFFLLGPVYYISFIIAQVKKAGCMWLLWPVILPAFTLPLIAGFIILLSILIYGYTTLAQVGYNAVQSYIGTQHETDAVVVDDFGEKNGILEYDYYYLTFTYEDPEGNEILMEKEVRPGVYDDGLATEALISYPTDNPYRVHTKGFALSDIFFYFERLIMPIMALLMTYAGFWLFRENRRQNLKDKLAHRKKSWLDKKKQRAK